MLGYRKLYKIPFFVWSMQKERISYNALLNKMLVTKEGKRIGFVKSITFETVSGELINLVVKDPTPYAKNLSLERTSSGDILVPYNAVIAIGDFMVVSEEDLI